MLQSVSIKPDSFFLKALDELTLDESRLKLLKKISNFIVQEYKKNKPIHLNFICTHNSRRSQLAQVWGYFAAQYYGLDLIKSYSGGTAITAFFRHTVKTLQEVGFRFQLLEFSHRNPVYTIDCGDKTKSIFGFSKLYDHPANKQPFIAITTCSNAEENCPFIPEAMQRFHLPFTDPKAYDGRHKQAEKYMETNMSIAGELHYIFKMVKELS